MKIVPWADLEKRKNWEHCAPNAQQCPDEQVLAMIEEIQFLRQGLSKLKDHFKGTATERLIRHFMEPHAA